MSVLGVLLRRSLALWAVPAFIAVELLQLRTGRGWTSEWRWAFDHLGGITIILGPLGAGVGAAAAVVWSTHGRGELVSVTRRPGRHYVGTCVAICAWVWAIHLAALAIAAVLVVRQGVPWRLDLVPALPGLAIVPAYVSTGLAVGTLRPAAWVCPAVVAATFVGTIAILQDASLRVLVRAGGATGSLIGLEYKGWLLVTLAVLWGVVALIGIAVAARPLRRRVLDARVVALTMVAVVAAATAVWLGPERFRVAPDPPLACQGTRPQVCTAPDYSAHLDSLTQTAGRLNRVIALAGVSAPRRYEQGARVRYHELPSGLVSFGTNLAASAPSSLAFAVLNSYVGCTPEAEQGRQVYDSATPLAWLLLDAAQAPERTDFATEVAPGFRTASPSHQQEWLRRAVPMLQRCLPAPVAS